MSPTKTSTSSSEKNQTTDNSVNADDIDKLVGMDSKPSGKSAPSPSPKRNGGRRFDGVVDDRVIPDAGVPTEEVYGVLDMEHNGHGLLRPEFAPSDRDVYISTSQIRRFRLRPGDMVKGPARRPKESERYWGLLKVTEVNGVAVDKLNESNRVVFDRLVPVYPDKQYNLETKKEILSTRLIDLVAPVGRGQRGLIVSPPKAGKTTILKEIANGLTTNYPDSYLMAVLVGERPEEVTDISRSIRGEVAASNFDEPPERQVKVAELALERAKRLVELGNHVVILLDSITRLARAYNLAIPTSGRTLSGGFDPAALYPPKRFFGAARNFEEFDTYDGKKTGSLTILGTALVDTGSRMDDLIYEEFKGTGNMELHLDRKLAERRIYPAIDVQKSGTRQDQLLFDKKTYDKIKTLITMIDMLGAQERTEILMERLAKTDNNQEFLESLGK
ncbi:MAG: transcription termination factor Rho [Patescibacteria group bacterium]|jgi:transcription termination factor Rho